MLAEISADLFAKAAARHPDRVLNVGIREQLMVSVAGGLSLAGLRPIVHTYAPFLVERAFEQVKLDLGHQGARAVLVSIGASYDAARVRAHPPGAGGRGAGGHGAGVRGAGAGASGRGARAAATGGGGAGLRFHLPAAIDREQPVRATVVAGAAGGAAGSAGVVVAVGPMLSPVLDAVSDLDVTVAYTTTVRPFDGEGLRALASSPASGAVVLVEPYLAGTSAYAASAALAGRSAFRLLSLGVGRTELRRYGTPSYHSALHGLDAAGIRRSVTDFLGLT